MERKAQAQVITTILIILLVLAVIVIVWQVVTRTVTTTTETLEEKSDCIGVSLDVTEAKASDNKVKITRLSGGPTEAVSVKILVGGTVVATTETATLLQLESKVYTISTMPDPLTAANQKVEVAAMIGTVACEVSDSIDSIA